MTNIDQASLRSIAQECVELADAEFGRRLDWSVDSLTVLDEICMELLADGSLHGDRLDLWWKLTGAYTGEAVISTYAGQWIAHEQASGAYAIKALTVTDFPFALANRILTGELYKSLPPSHVPYQLSANARPATNIHVGTS